MKGAIAFLVLSVTVLFLILLFALKPWGSTTTTRAPSPPETMVLPMPIPNLIPEIPQIPPADTTLAKPPSAAMQMQFTAIINWWDKDDPDTPSKVAQRLGFAPNIGTFYDLTKEWPRDRFANEINQIVEMRSKFKNLWSPIVIDVAILPRGGFPAFEALFDQIGNSFKEAEAKGIRVRTRALTEVNGEWFPYSTGNYDEIKGVLRKFYTAIKSRSPSTSIMFNPNFSYGGCGQNEKLDARNYDPGPQFHDECGLDIYRHNPKCVNQEPKGDEIRSAINACGFYDSISSSGQLFSIAETSRATKLGCGPLPPDFDFKAKSNWLKQIFSPELRKEFPLLYNVGIFDFKKYEDGEDRDFRMTYDPRLVAIIRQGVGLTVDMAAKPGMI